MFATFDPSFSLKLLLKTRVQNLYRIFLFTTSVQNSYLPLKFITFVNNSCSQLLCINLFCKSYNFCSQLLSQLLLTSFVQNFCLNSFSQLLFTFLHNLFSQFMITTCAHNLCSEFCITSFDHKSRLLFTIFFTTVAKLSSTWQVQYQSNWELRIALISVWHPPTQPPAQVFLSWNLVWKWYSTKLGKLAN